MDKIKEEIIKLLQNDKELPEEYESYLFPVSHKEYELTYSGKILKQKILSFAEEPQSIPFQKIKQFGNCDSEWKNMLIFGDNFQILKTFYENKDEIIKNKVKGKVKLIYIDPPFATSDEFSNKEGAKAYSDKIKGAEFLEFLRERLIIAKEILSDDGTIYVHLDSKMVHYVKVIMDEVFDKNNFVNEIIWQYFMGGKGKKEFAKKHDTILMYAKNKGQHIFNQQTIKRYYDFVPSLKDDSALGQSGHDEIGYWGLVKCPDVWPIKGVFNMGKEYLSYPTQKPEELIERIITASTNEGDIVMDFFAGSGTTGFVAEKLNRKWIMCDIGKLSIYTIQKRFLTKNDGYQPFDLINAGCYDLKTIFNLDKAKYTNFVRDLFHIDLQSKKINGISLDGKRRGDWVKIFNFQDFDGNTTAIDESYIQELHNNIGTKIGHRFYIVAPEMNIDIVGDYFQVDDVKYYLLRIPYQAIKELHTKEFKKAEQPKNQNGINLVENSIGFYFNETPEVNREIINKGNNVCIKINSVKPQYDTLNGNEDILAMVLVDTSGKDEFVMQKAYFADEIRIEETDSFSISIDKKEIKSNIISIIFIDIYGNEFKERIKI